MENTIAAEPSNAQALGAHVHAPVVEELRILLDTNPDMRQSLLDSLEQATSLAKQNLDTGLYNAINDEFQGNGWPTTIEAYLDYLDLYVRMVPNESDDPRYPNGWKSNGKANGYNQKVYDLLCQFYWLVDQKKPGTDLTMQSYESFAHWLIQFANAWGSFLDTPPSLTKESLHSFKYDPMYNYHLYADNQSTWNTFNEFFYREFNGADPQTGITPLRPIAEPNNNLTIVSPADCTFKQDYPIDSQGYVLDRNLQKTQISLKKTHSIGNVDQLLDNSNYAQDFYGGCFVHYFLSPFDYHRFHTPVSGKVLEIEAVRGNVFLDVNLTRDGQWDAPDGAGNGYEFNQARGIIIIDTECEVGKVAILPIGMAQVSGVMMNTQLKGQNVMKGQEFGKFRFGGSDIIMLFQKAPKDLYLFKKDPGHVPIHFQYGQTAVYWNK